MAKTSKPNPQLDADVDYIAVLFAKAFTVLPEVGVMEGIKLGRAFKNVGSSRAHDDLFVQTFIRYCELNPKAAEKIELAASLSPFVAKMLDYLRLRPKQVPPEDVEVKDAEPC